MGPKCRHLYSRKEDVKKVGGHIHTGHVHREQGKINLGQTGEGVTQPQKHSNSQALMEAGVSPGLHETAALLGLDQRPGELLF